MMPWTTCFSEDLLPVEPSQIDLLSQFRPATWPPLRTSMSARIQDRRKPQATPVRGSTSLQPSGLCPGWSTP